MHWFALAAAGELVGCFAVLQWWRGGSPWLLLVAGFSLGFFAWCLAQAPSPYAGRTYAAYAGIYLLGSLLWLLLVDRVRPDRWDLLGGALALAGALVILHGPRGPAP